MPFAWQVPLGSVEEGSEMPTPVVLQILDSSADPILNASCVAWVSQRPKATSKAAQKHLLHVISSLSDSAGRASFPDLQFSTDGVAGVRNIAHACYEI